MKKSNKPQLLSTRILSDRLRKTAQDAGIELEEVDFIHTEIVNNDALVQRIKRLSGEQVPAIFTSANAVRGVATLLEQAGIQQVAWTICTTSGPTRVRARQAFPGATIGPKAGNAADLAKAVLGMQPKPRYVLFFCGQMRRDELPQTLFDRGIEIEEYVVYQTISRPKSLEGKHHGLLFFSPSSVESYFAANDPGPDTLCVVIGDTTAQALKRKAPTLPVYSAPTPSKEAALQLAIKLLLERKSDD